MDAVNLIFNTYFQVVPYDFFAGIMAVIFCFEFILTLTENWDIL
jgi:hypothetical protein